MIFIQREKSLFYKQILQMLDISPPKTKHTKHIYTLKKKEKRGLCDTVLELFKCWFNWKVFIDF